MSNATFYLEWLGVDKNRSAFFHSLPQQANLEETFLTCAEVSTWVYEQRTVIHLN